MSKALELIKKIDEIGYYGMKNDYSTKGYDQDTGEYLGPFSDLQLPDKDGPGDVAQTKKMTQKSDGSGKKVR
jgi:hypothetical protein